MKNIIRPIHLVQLLLLILVAMAFAGGLNEPVILVLLVLTAFLGHSLATSFWQTFNKPRARGRLGQSSGVTQADIPSTAVSQVKEPVSVWVFVFLGALVGFVLGVMVVGLEEPDATFWDAVLRMGWFLAFWGAWVGRTLHAWFGNSGNRGVMTFVMLGVILGLRLGWSSETGMTGPVFLTMIAWATVLGWGGAVLGSRLLKVGSGAVRTVALVRGSQAWYPLAAGLMSGLLGINLTAVWQNAEAQLLQWLTPDVLVFGLFAGLLGYSAAKRVLNIAHDILAPLLGFIFISVLTTITLLAYFPNATTENALWYGTLIGTVVGLSFAGTSFIVLGMAIAGLIIGGVLYVRDPNLLGSQTNLSLLILLGMVLWGLTAVWSHLEKKSKQL